MADNIRVRLAPSPTGKLHIGTARTALFNYLFAKRYGGTFILRIEDTDQDRSSEDYLNNIMDGLKWLGLNWDEGPEAGGPFEPYFQQERLELYQPFIDQLLQAKQAYRCYCTKEELDQERAQAEAKKLPPKYSGQCRHLSAQEIDRYEREGREFAVRLVVEPQVVTFTDLIRDEVTFDASLFGDFVIVRSNGLPLFIFTNVIDDHLMEISHVLRGEDHLSNTAKQIVIAKALNVLSPQFGHLPLIINADRTKMSKRRDPVSITDDFRDQGYLPEAMNNFIALLGWSSGADREIYSLQELASEFLIERVGKSPSVFDPEKLLWMNGYYIRQKKIGDLADLAKPFITDVKLIKAVEDKPELYLQAIAIVQERMKTLKEVQDLIGFIFFAPTFEPKLLIAKKSSIERTITALESALEVIPKIPALCQDDCELVLRQAAKDHDLKDGELLWAVRVALSGLSASPGAFELLDLLGKDESTIRLKKALTSLRKRS